jgi:hypothetical protein
MNLLDKLNESILPIPFVYWDFIRANNKVNITKLPCVVCVRNPKSQLINQNGNYVEQSDFVLFFVDHAKPNLTSFENEKIIENMKNLAVKFIRKVKRESVLSIIGGYSIEKVYDYLDTNVTGSGLVITLRENKGNIKCFKDVD